MFSYIQKNIYITGCFFIIFIIALYFIFGVKKDDKKLDPRIQRFPKIPNGCELPPYVSDIRNDKYKIIVFNFSGPEAEKKMTEKYGLTDPTGKDGWKVWAPTQGTFLCKKDNSVAWHLGQPSYNLINNVNDWNFNLTREVITDPSSENLPKKICGQVDRLNLYFPIN